MKPFFENKKYVYAKIVELNLHLAEQQKILSAYIAYKAKVDFLREQFFLGLHDKKYNKNKVLLALISGQMLPEILTLNYVKSNPIKNKGVFFVLPVEVIVTGNRRNIKEFFYQIENLQYPILLSQFKWSFFDCLEEEKGKLTLLFIVYLENSFFKCIFFRSNQGSVFNSVFVDKEILVHYPLSEIKMIGFLANLMGKKWRLIQLPNNNFYKVELDDRLGSKQGYIILIDNKKIIVQEKNNRKTITLAA